MPLMLRTHHRRSLRWLGDPILPDSFNAASGEAFSFSPGTPDATIMAVLTQFNQQLPANLAATWAAAQGKSSSGATGSATNTNPVPAVTPSGAAVSTQTGAGLRLVNINNIASGVYQCTFSDGSQNYCDVDGNPISYTPPTSTPATTPAAASQPAATTTPSATPMPSTSPIQNYIPIPAVTPSGTPISTTTGTPAPATTSPAASPTSGDIMFGSFDLTTFLTGTAIGTIPNWVWLAGGAAALFMFAEGSGSSRRR